MDFQSTWEGVERFSPRNPMILARNKDFHAEAHRRIPILFSTPHSPRPYYYSQIEVAVGLVGSARVGFNPGELVDFLLGWFKIDIYDDDIGGGEDGGKQEKAVN